MANDMIRRESTIRKVAGLLGNTEASFEVASLLGNTEASFEYGRLYYWHKEYNNITVLKRGQITLTLHAHFSTSSWRTETVEKQHF